MSRPVTGPFYQNADNKMEPDYEFDPKDFATDWRAHDYRIEAFKDHLLCYGDEGFDFDKTWTDSYDQSVEISGVPASARLNLKQRQLLQDCGFNTCFVNHVDGIETHYNLKNLSEGWRRKHTENGFEISYWPEGWSKATENWLASGYMKINPDL